MDRLQEVDGWRRFKKVNPGILWMSSSGLLQATDDQKYGIKNCLGTYIHGGYPQISSQYAET